MVILMIDMIVRDGRRFCVGISLPRKFLRELGDKFPWTKQLERGGFFAFTRVVVSILYRVTWACLDLGMLVCLLLHLHDLRRLTTDGKSGLLNRPELWSYGN